MNYKITLAQQQKELDAALIKIAGLREQIRQTKQKIREEEAAQPQKPAGSKAITVKRKSKKKA